MILHLVHRLIDVVGVAAVLLVVVVLCSAVAGRRALETERGE